MFKKLAVLAFILIFVASIPCFSQEEQVKDVKKKEDVKQEEVKKEEAVKGGEVVKEPELPFQPKTWEMPSYMALALQAMVNDFNRTYNEELEKMKGDLKANFPGFEDMPTNANDVIYVPQKDANGKDTGVFITREDYIKFQNQQQLKN